MPRKPKPPTKAITTPELNVPQELLDQLVKGPMTQGDLEVMFRSLKKVVIERAMSAEMSEHLGYGHGESKPEGQANQRNGTTGKTVITDDGPVRMCWVFGSSRLKGPNSGSRCSMSFEAAVLGTSSLPWSMASKASVKRLRRHFPAPRCRPASCTSSATAWITQAGKTADTW